MNKEIETLQKWMDSKFTENVVFFGGAGVSTESGIPDFRSKDGLYNQQYSFPPETILSHAFYENNPEEFYRFYRNKLVFPDAKPNKAHKKLAEWEAKGKVKAVITQNIDGLHQKAGSKVVLELHGSTGRNYCEKCGREYGQEYILQSDGVPVCKECGGCIRPDVVLYDEKLDEKLLWRAAEYIYDCDMLIVGGTSLNVYPAAGLLNYYHGSKLVLINKTKTPQDRKADLIIREPIGKVLGQIVV